jgi:hypothetical protein
LRENLRGDGERRRRGKEPNHRYTVRCETYIRKLICVLSDWNFLMKEVENNDKLVL